MGILEQEMKRLAQQAGGSHKTVHDRIKLAQRFCERLVLAQNVQIRRVEQLKARHIEGYIRERLTQGITKRSLQNEMAAVRCILKHRLAQSERLNNRSLGLSGASRNGTKLAIMPEHYRDVLEMARAKDPGMAAALELSRLMGLRSQEAVQSAQSLRTWKQSLERGEPRLTVVFGTKGGRPRETIILDAVAVRKVLDNALAVAEDRHGRLIDKPDLKSAMKYWHSQTAGLGLTGAYSPHSLRYAWAQNAIRHYLAQGFCEKEALAMTAMDLGHGDGRGRYVAQVYGRRDTD
ncbi:DNA-binding protein [Salmonella enterica subsp. enterica serovar Havana]|nr:DNA-binding protein [Salmonella enterica subsp. enterica serovar Havana]EFV0488392.1 DNA-binding protein [Salmonella enterica]EBW6529527.1 DNA-binding protein [Salmonella enterica subsp. enterica serovar Havana]EBX9529322.1 DNA-binding protein [Salmonella enterica subsp. enterica serovar Havana]EBY1125070.1 DNA-binding protein [Salmonella enterica subsp. enterica serovar Havana]